MSDLGQRLNAALTGRYVVQGKLGMGGMATVWRAQDLRHHRPVAIKVLHEEISSAMGTDRFLQEVRITARLNHPHVLPLLDSGEADGLLFSVMPLVTGDSLRGLLSREGRLPLAQTVHIVRQVASALDHAHRQGVVHRDVKPENILFSEGHAVVSDFGIARAVSLAGPQHLTRTGFGLGTLGYMSPEQAAGREDIDERADVFALATVAYEMLLASTPGGWMTDDAVRVGRYLDASQAHRELLDALPGRVEQVLVKSLAVSPASRHPSPGAFAEAFEKAAEGTRSLTDAEVQELLRRATELELEEDAGDPGALTMGALEQVAAQAGITPTKIRKAAREMAVAGHPIPAPAEMKRKKGTEYLYADGMARREMDAGDHERLVTEIQNQLGIVGHVSLVGRTLTWSPATPGDDARKLVVILTGREGTTEIHAEERLELSGWRMMIPGWGIAGGLGASLLTLFALGLNPDAYPLAFIAGGGTGLFVAVNGFFRINRKKRLPELHALVQHLGRIIEAPSPLQDTGEPAKLTDGE